MAATRPLYAVVGADRFLRGSVLAEILKTLEPETDALGPVRVDSDRDLADVLDEVRTPSLLGGRRVVIVDDADDFITANRKALERYAGDPSPDGCLILLCDSLPKNTNLHKIIAEHGEIRVCEVLKGMAMNTWMVRRAKEAHGKRLAEPAARRLRDLIGNEPGWIDTELGKLAAYVGARNDITVADVESATGESREEKVFAVVNKMADGDLNGAMQAWQQVFATDRAAPGRAIGGLAYGFRELLKARRQWDAGTDLARLAPRLFTDPATLRRRLEAMPVERLEGLQRSLLEADLAVKTGASTVEVAIEKLLVRHGVAAPTRKTRVG